MPDLQHILATRFKHALTKAFGDAHAEADAQIRPSANPKFGDYQANLAMGLAKTLGAKPRDVAQKIIDQLEVSDLCEKVEIAGPGFINLHLSAGALSGHLAAMVGDASLGLTKAQPPLNIVIDYSGPNVAKEMHVGHLRSTVIGDCLARVLEFTGHHVIRQNHLGDWGTQFGMLIEHLIDQGKADGLENARGGQPLQIADLNALYQTAKRRFDDEPEFKTRAQRRVVKLQSGDEQSKAIWQALIEESKHHFNAIYRQLGVMLTDDDLRAESFYNPLLAPVIEDLEQKGLARQSEGALCVFPPGFADKDGQPRPLIVRKSDGGYGYGTTDLAAIRFRVAELNAQRIIYCVDARQKDHLAMVFATAKTAQWIDDKRCAEHVAFGTVLGDDNKPFKTRSGETVKLADLLDEAEQRAAVMVAQKNPELDAGLQAAVARAIGIGAIKYADLSSDRIKDYVFAWDRMLSFEGNTAPYLQYSYVRIRSIFRRAREQGLLSEGVERSAIALDTPAERALAVKLLQWPAVIESVAQSLEPHRLCNYLYELAAGYHQFFEQCPVLRADTEAQRNSRLALCDLVANTLRTGLMLLGIEVVEQM